MAGRSTHRTEPPGTAEVQDPLPGPESRNNFRGTGTELLLRLGKDAGGGMKALGKQYHFKGGCRARSRTGPAARRAGGKRGGVPTPTRSSARGLCHVVPIVAG